MGQSERKHTHIHNSSVYLVTLWLSSKMLFYVHRKGQGSLKFGKKNDDDDEDANDSGTVMLP